MVPMPPLSRVAELPPLHHRQPFGGSCLSVGSELERGLGRGCGVTKLQLENKLGSLTFQALGWGQWL